MKGSWFPLNVLGSWNPSVASLRGSVVITSKCDVSSSLRNSGITGGVAEQIAFWGRKQHFSTYIYHGKNALRLFVGKKLLFYYPKPFSVNYEFPYHFWAFPKSNRHSWRTDEPWSPAPHFCRAACPPRKGNFGSNAKKKFIFIGDLVLAVFW